MITHLPLDNGVRGVEDGEIDDELIQDTTSFMKACDEGNVNMVNMLLWKYYMSERKRGLLTHGLGELSENPHDKSSTALHKACTSGHLSIVTLLLEEVMMDVNVRDRECRATPIHEAAWFKHHNLIKYLIEKGADIQAHDKFNRSVLCVAAFRNNLQLVKYLVEYCSIDVENNDGILPLHVAARRGNLQIVKYFIEECCADLYQFDNKGWTVLHEAACDGHTVLMDNTPVAVVLEYLCSTYSLDVHAKDFNGCTPLHIAAINGQLIAVKYLIQEAHAIVDAIDKNGETPLHKAASKGRLEIVKYLIEECGASLMVKDYDGNLPIHSAGSHRDVSAYLYDKIDYSPPCPIS